jgi:hypothetical protein
MKVNYTYRVQDGRLVGGKEAVESLPDNLGGLFKEEDYK